VLIKLYQIFHSLARLNNPIFIGKGLDDDDYDYCHSQEIWH